LNCLTMIDKDARDAETIDELRALPRSR